MDSVFKVPSSLDEFVSMYRTDAENFKILNKVPLVKGAILNQLPYMLREAVGDELPMIILRLYTSGQSYQKDNIIELGMTKARYSPSKGIITEICAVYRGIEDPKVKIKDDITLQTGLDNEYLIGRFIDQQEVASFMAGTQLVVCHNAMFERRFFEKKFQLLDNFNWVSSLREIPWRTINNRIRSLDLTSLLLESGYFYERKTAIEETLALLWLMILQPLAFNYVLKALIPSGAIIYAFGSPYEVKEILKQRNYHWDAHELKVWYKVVSKAEYVEQEIEFLRKLYDRDMAYIKIKHLSANVRYKYDLLG